MQTKSLYLIVDYGTREKNPRCSQDVLCQLKERQVAPVVLRGRGRDEGGDATHRWRHVKKARNLYQLLTMSSRRIGWYDKIVNI